MNLETRSSKRLPRTVWALGFTSLFMDVSSELIHGLLPLFLVVSLGASAAVLGLIEGIAEAAAQIVRVFSGWLSDSLQRRKALAVAGYGLAALTKPIFPLAHAVWLVAFARVLDRIGKGVRGAPRDALVADVTPSAQRGAAFGLRQSLDTVGATLGPLLVIGLMMLLDDDIRAVMWFAVIPACISVAILVLFVREPAPKKTHQARRVPIKAREIGALGGRLFWLVVAAGAAFTLARFSEAFLVIRAHDAGLALTLAPAVIAVMSLVFAVSAYPAGRLQDRFGARPLLVVGAGGVDRGRSVSRLRERALPHLPWHRSMGSPYGVHPRCLVGAHRPCGTGAAARHRVRTIRFGHRACNARGEHRRRGELVSPEATFLAGAGFAATALIAFLVVRDDARVRRPSL